MQPISHTGKIKDIPSPCLSANWNAFTSLMVSSTDLPTGRSLTAMCLKIPFLSITNKPTKQIILQIKT